MTDYSFPASPRPNQGPTAAAITRPPPPRCVDVARPAQYLPSFQPRGQAGQAARVAGRSMDTAAGTLQVSMAPARSEKLPLSPNSAAPRLSRMANGLVCLSASRCRSHSL